MSRTAIEVLLYLLDQGFDGNEEHSLMGNLRDVRDEDWDWRAPGSGRSIRDIALHAATAKYVYGNQAFGDASVAWAAGSPEVYARDASVEEGRSLLQDAHGRFRASVSAVEAVDLQAQRKVHYGGTADTRFIIATMIQHDFYHAGEINHLRASRQGTDFWPGTGPAERGVSR